ncbi:Fe-S oxidoreductase [Fervidicella metallireducens AeB]|uniref:Fe-S oxidoreductase n=1 Tax=Fervidicella metallireducens AeB TaxID=1403537 RepID=A0A017RVV2_9CLOT|nr:radical SAM/SPASM domain-containing protein [Fervidicella metallireducens]EYE88741.1 Fe-S oxidoreductase [Fervidicella metallireducens AeB]
MKKLKKIYVEITNVCNLSCSFCTKTNREPEFMTLETFNKILEQIKHHTKFIYFHVKGEPLLHPELDKFLDLCYDKGFKVNITTNGTLINDVKNKLLNKPALRQINFSLHSFQGDETLKEEYVENIISFTKEAIEKTNMLIAFRLWNLHEDNNINLIQKKNQDIIDKLKCAFDIEFGIEERIPQDRGIKLIDRIYLNQGAEFDWPSLDSEEDFSKGFCYALRNQAAILVDGTVIPCCLDGDGIINLGNIHEKPFSDIIEGERARKLFDGFSRREVVEELCRKCGYRKKFS